MFIEEFLHRNAFEFEDSVFKWNEMVMIYKNKPIILQMLMSKVPEILLIKAFRFV